MARGTMVAEEIPARERILRAAVEIIAAEGEEALRLADVAAAAGVALSLTTHYFRTRDHRSPRRWPSGSRASSATTCGASPVSSARATGARSARA